jgi:alkanesulfonate monooxygenase SsuD/methylene tetrahydromethanopterin reductase-like flavin-dependent oxidoreductase (luciferase family)
MVDVIDAAHSRSPISLGRHDGGGTHCRLKGMALRIFTEPQQGASYEQLLAVARTAEECGFSAFFRSDHVLKMGSASGLPAATDAWVTLAGLARDTSSIRLGTLVSPVTFRPVGTFIVIAAQVDHMSGGRLEIGVGAGWYEAEHQAFGLPFPPARIRHDLLEDELAILNGAWLAPAGAVFELTGRTCAVRLAADTVRPHQRPRPPIVLGGKGGPRSARLAAAHADEYNSSFVPPEVMRGVHEGVRRACERGGRDPSTLVWSTLQVLCCGRTEAEISRRAAAIGREVGELRQNGLAGTPAEVLEKLGRYADSGADRFYLQVLDVTDLDHLRLVAEEVLPHAPGR